MDRLKLETTYIPHMRNQFAIGSCVLFLGAGFSLEASNLRGQSLPSANKLTELIWNICYPGDPVEKNTELQDIYEYAAGQCPKQLTELLRHTFFVDPDTCPDWYRQLLTMPWLRIYTLNIDNLVEQVLSTQNTHRRFRLVSARQLVQR